jgi:hypothetical protein
MMFTKVMRATKVSVGVNVLFPDLGLSVIVPNRL